MSRASQPWDSGKPVAAKGRYYVNCPPNIATILQVTSGAIGDDIDWLWLFPQTTTPGAVYLYDGATVVYLWPAGITLTDTRPIFVPLNLTSREGPWIVITGVNITALGAGQFQ